MIKKIAKKINELGAVLRLYERPICFSTTVSVWELQTKNFINFDVICTKKEKTFYKAKKTPFIPIADITSVSSFIKKLVF